MTRVLIFLLVLGSGALGAAAPAAAQDVFALTAARDAEHFADQQALRQRDIIITNELARLQAQAQTTQGLSDLAATQARPAVPTTPFNPNAPPPSPGKFAQIPDEALADSNARVRAAAANRR